MGTEKNTDKQEEKVLQPTDVEHREPASENAEGWKKFRGEAQKQPQPNKHCFFVEWLARSSGLATLEKYYQERAGFGPKP